MRESFLEPVFLLFSVDHKMTKRVHNTLFYHSRIIITKVKNIPKKLPLNIHKTFFL